MSKDGIVAVATLILLGVVSHYSDPYNPWINLLARVGNALVFLYILWRAAGKSLVAALTNRRAAIADEIETLAARKAEAEAQLAAKLQVQLSAELGDALLNMLGLELQILAIVKALLGHALTPYIRKISAKFNILYFTHTQEHRQGLSGKEFHKSFGRILWKKADSNSKSSMIR